MLLLTSKAVSIVINFVFIQATFVNIVDETAPLFITIVIYGKFIRKNVKSLNIAAYM